MYFHDPLLPLLTMCVSLRVPFPPLPPLHPTLLSDREPGMRAPIPLPIRAVRCASLCTRQAMHARGMTSGDGKGRAGGPAPPGRRLVVLGPASLEPFAEQIGVQVLADEHHLRAALLVRAPGPVRQALEQHVHALQTGTHPKG